MSAKDPQAELVFAAVDRAAYTAISSTHPKERVGAVLFSPTDDPKKLRALANIVPPELESTFPRDHRLGTASIYLHSEISAFFSATRPVEGLWMAVTTPPCPNCAKMIVEAGIARLFIDTQGLSGAFARERAGDIKDMSMEIFRRAGVSVHLVNRKTSHIKPAVDADTLDIPPVPANTHRFHVPEGGIATLIPELQRRFEGEAFALARVRLDRGLEQAYLTLASLPPGFTPERYLRSEQDKEGKYRFPVDPMNRLLIHCKRFGLQLMDGHVICSMHPSSRALVNAVAARVHTITTLRDEPDHGEMGPAVGQELQEHGIMTVIRKAPVDGAGPVPPPPQPRSR